MRTLHLSVALSFFLHSFIPVSYAAGNYIYRQNIVVPDMEREVTAGVELNPLTHNFGNTYRILDGSDSPVPTNTEDLHVNILKGATILSGPDASSKETSLEQMFDGNPDTTFAPVITTEHRFLLQTDEPIAPQHLSYQMKSGSIDRIRFRYGKSSSQLTSSFLGAPSSTRISIFSEPSTVFEVTIETSGSLEIAELKLLATKKILLFAVQPNEQYTLAYGSTDSDEVDPIDMALHLAGAVKATLGTIAYAGNQGVDMDGDTVPDAADNCPQDANTNQIDQDKDGMGDFCDPVPLLSNTKQADSDNDGISDETDNCLNLYNTDQKDIDGDGVGWVCDDDDEDGIVNGEDNCIGVPNPNQERTGGSGLGNSCKGDSDGDGVLPENDNCSDVPNADQADADGDGHGDPCDTCPLLYNPVQHNTEDGIVCESSTAKDVDQDGIENEVDTCVFVSDPEQQDSDNDNIGDVCDNCPQTPNALQQDYNSDGKGDACSDVDGDGIPDAKDNCPAHSNPGQEDADGDNIGNSCEDDDSDRVVNADDNCPSVPNMSQEDRDSDGSGNECDEIDNRLQKSRNVRAPYIIGGGLAVLAALFSLRRKQSKSPEDLY